MYKSFGQKALRCTILFYTIFRVLSMKKSMIFIISLIILISMPFSAFAAVSAYDIEPPKYEPEIALLVNADTDTVVYEKNSTTVTAPASLTKLVTALVVFSKGDSLDTEITCSEEAINSILGTGSSVAGLYAGEKTTLEMLLFCLLLPSANDAAAVLAYHYGNGSEQAFVDEMNALAKSLGCENTYFANPHGLDDDSVKGYDSDTQSRTTAYDMYLIAKEALKNETMVYMTSKYGKTMPATNKSDIRYLYNTNQLLNSYSYYYYDGTVGLKTGTTDKAGSCLITSATKNGYTYIAVAMRGRSDYIIDGEARNTAFLMCRYMLRWAFENMQMKVIADTSRNMGEVSVKFGKGNDYVALVPSKTVSAVVLYSAEFDDMKIVLDEGFPKIIDAPVEAGQVIGKAKLMYGDIEISELELVAANEVKKNYIWAMFSVVEDVVSSKYFLIIVGVVVIVILLLLRITKNKRRRDKRRKSRVDVINNFSNLS